MAVRRSCEGCSARTLSVRGSLGRDLDGAAVGAEEEADELTVRERPSCRLDRHRRGIFLDFLRGGLVRFFRL